MNILFVCTGNICRSPMAEGYLKYLCKQKGWNCNIKSAGTSACNGEPASEHAVQVLSETGIDISSHLSRTLRREQLDWADRIIVMSASHKDFILRRFESVDLIDKIYLLNEFTGSGKDVFDPFGGDIECYRECFHEIKKALDKFIDTVD